MKINEVILKEQNLIQGEITKKEPSPESGKQRVTISTLQGPVTTDIDPKNPAQFQSVDGKPVITIPAAQTDLLKVGQPITLNQQSTQPGSTQPPTQSPTQPNNTNQMSVTEVIDDFSDLTDEELVQAAIHKGYEDRLDFNEDDMLTNREEVISLLQHGDDISGDATDDFIDDVEDQEFDQMMERMKQLSGLSSNKSSFLSTESR